MIYNMATAVKLTVEDLMETTTTANIAYLPGGFSNVNKVLQTLARMKKKWGVTLHEKEDSIGVAFEDKLQVDVKRSDFREFLESVLGIRTTNGLSKFDVDLTARLVEAREAESEKLVNSLATQFNKTMKKYPLMNIRTNIEAWIQKFGVISYETGPNVLIRASEEAADVEAMFARITREFNEDVGNLQQMIDFVKDQRTLVGFDVLGEKEFLYGARIKSNLFGEDIWYEGLVNVSFQPVETIMIYEDEVLDEVDDVLSDVKVSGKLIYPVGKTFSPSVFNEIESIMEDVI